MQSRPQRRWSAEEDNILQNEVKLQIAENHGKVTSWKSIAQKIPGRTNKDCRKRFHNAVGRSLKKGPWTDEEDTLLKAQVAELGTTWSLVAKKMKTRSADQCAKRWQHCLDPKLDHSSWAEEENIRLLNAVKTYGTPWKYIQTHLFPERSANNVKNQAVQEAHRKLLMQNHHSDTKENSKSTLSHLGADLDIDSSGSNSFDSLLQPYSTWDGFGNNTQMDIGLFGEDYDVTQTNFTMDMMPPSQDGIIPSPNTGLDESSLYTNTQLSTSTYFSGMGLSPPQQSALDLDMDVEEDSSDDEDEKDSSDEDDDEVANVKQGIRGDRRMILGGTENMPSPQTSHSDDTHSSNERDVVKKRTSTNIDGSASWYGNTHAKVTICLEDPDPTVIVELMGMLIKSKSKMAINME